MFMYARLYLPKDDPEVERLRNMIVAASYATLGSFKDDLAAEATKKIRDLLNDDDQFRMLLSLGKNKETAVGGPATFCLLSLIQQNFASLVREANLTDPKSAGPDGVEPYFNIEAFAFRDLSSFLHSVHGDGNAFHDAFVQFMFTIVMLEMLAFPWIAFTAMTPWATVFTTGWFWFVVGGMLDLGCDMTFALDGAVSINCRALLKEIEADIASAWFDSVPKLAKEDSVTTKTYSEEDST
ncbi:MAG: hypothetical protein SGARI_003694, partial [Bacillariaceae sp.]